MKELFKKLAGKSGISYVQIVSVIRENTEEPVSVETYSATPEQLQKFAELIIHECSEFIFKNAPSDESACELSSGLEEYFGVTNE
jgi:hypothetical protein